MNDKFKALLQGFTTEGWEYGDGTLVADDAKAYLDYVEQLEQELRQANDTVVSHANTISRIETANVHLQEENERIEQELKAKADTVKYFYNQTEALKAENHRLREAAIPRLLPEWRQCIENHDIAVRQEAAREITE